MKRLNWIRKKLLTIALIVLLSLGLVGIYGGLAAAETPSPVEPMEADVSQGALRVKTDGGVVECPLKHTDVKVNITGFIARVSVKQTFHNPYDENIEAVYVFPLPHTAAVDAMTMQIGERKIVGVMKRRDEARAIYEQAIVQGKTASLLEQERPNIFTQSVGNIKPRQEIQIDISYVDVLDYDMGTYEFHFPMVVGPRYIPGAPLSDTPELPKELEGKVGEVEKQVAEVTLGDTPSGTGWSPDTTRVPDASRITPPVLKPGYRTGHNISLSVSLDAGVPIQDMESVNHTAVLEQVGTSKATAEISPMDAIPNKDFVMKYRVLGEKPELAVFAHADGPGQRYFMLMLQPKLEAELAKAPPRELVFLVDVSGSMSGEPMAKVKAALRHFFRLSKPNDTLQVITFASQAHQLFEKSVPATAANIARALTATQVISGGGGTEMLEGIKKVLNAPVDPERVRIVVLLTDGHIGNESEIIAEVGKRAGDALRFWTLGIGSSPNRFLLDGVAKQGGGMSRVLDLNTDPRPLVAEIVERIHSAQLAHIQVDWKPLTVYETYPRRIPELWAGRPIILFGRYAAGGKAAIKVSGTAEGKPITYTLDVVLPDTEAGHDVLAKVWARKKIEDLSAQMYYANTPEVVEEITRIALDYRLMSRYTSFVAVDENDVADLSQQPQPPRRVVVPVPLPEGVDFEGIFGEEKEDIPQFLKEEPQFFYNFFHREGAPQHGLVDHGQLSDAAANLVPSKDAGFRGRYTEFAIADSKRFRPAYQHQKEINASGELIVGWTGQMAPSRLQSFRAQASRLDALEHKKWLFSPDAEQVRMSGRNRDLRTEHAKAAVADAEALQQTGDLEASRTRYQHALGLMDGIQVDESLVATTSEAIQGLSEEIAKKRAEAYPGLNRNLNVVLRNQPLAEAIRRLVNAGGFHLDLVPGSVTDVAGILDILEPQVTYLDLRHATVVQGLTWLLTPYHLTWQMKDEKTITVGTARRMPGTSVWGYSVADLVTHLKAERNEEPLLKNFQNTPAGFLKAIRTVIDPEENAELEPDSVTLIPPGRLLVYGYLNVHEKVYRFLEASRDGETDIASLAEGELSTEMRADLKTLQKLTSARWKTLAKARQLITVAKARQRVLTDLTTASWPLLAAAIHDEVNLEALTRLQAAWAAPELEAIIEDNRYLAMRSAWCIRTAARAVPTDAELTALSKRVLSKVKKIEVLQPKGDNAADYLGSLYAVLAGKTQNAQEREVRTAIKALMEVDQNPELKMVHLIGESLLSPSAERDKALQAALAAHQVYGDDLVLLTCLIAKRRGGQLWQTFREELPAIATLRPLSGHIVVIINRLAASRGRI